MKLFPAYSGLWANTDGKRYASAETIATCAALAGAIEADTLLPHERDWLVILLWDIYNHAKISALEIKPDGP